MFTQDSDKTKANEPRLLKYEGKDFWKREKLTHFNLRRRMGEGGGAGVGGGGGGLRGDCRNKIKTHTGG